MKIFLKILTNRIQKRGIIYKYFRWFWERFYLIEPMRTNYNLWEAVDEKGNLITGEKEVKAYYARIHLSNKALKKLTK